MNGITKIFLVFSVLAQGWWGVSQISFEPRSPKIFENWYVFGMIAETGNYHKFHPVCFSKSFLVDPNGGITKLLGFSNVEILNLGKWVEYIKTFFSTCIFR